MKPDKVYLCVTMLLIFTTISWISSCTHQADISNIPEVCFGDVLNIYAAKCSIPGCHDGTGETELILKEYNDIRNTVVPGNSDASMSYKAIITTWGENRMPPDQPISQESRTIIRLWIDQGARDNRGDHVVCPISNPTTSGSGANF
jgi:hypothetical protein